MKLLVFAHTPPPHHGQSYMVHVMLTGFGGDRRRQRGPAPDNRHGIECYHVNARVSKDLEDIGDFRLGKFILMLGYCLQAIWCRFRYGVTTMYYIPAPGKKSALYRDWMVLLLCRPFYKRVILHWHAAGLGKWLETSVQIRHRSATYRFLKNVDLSVVLSNYNRADAEKLFPQHIKIVSNGIPDPCADFEENVLPRRRARFAARKKLLAGPTLTPADLENSGGDPHIFKILYLAHCTRDKGLFDTIDGVVLANRQLAGQRSPVSIRLIVAGNFINQTEKNEFGQLMKNPDIARAVHYLGFVSGDKKNQALRDASLFCFPTCYANENQPVNLIEAMAFGLPILTTRWRSLPEMFPPDYPGLVNVRDPQQIADALERMMTGELGEDGFNQLRQRFLKNFTLESHLEALAAAMHSTETQQPSGARVAEARGI